MTSPSAALSAGRDFAPAVAIVGPTAIGKTAVALELAHRFEGKAELLSVDSVQVYRKLDIGSAKPTAQERGAAKFHLIDLIDPDQPFTVADYQKAALEAAEVVQQLRGNRIVLVGGTGLYFRALTQPLGLPHVPPDDSLRAEMQQYEQDRGAGALHERLRELDKRAAEKMHPNDTKRIIRALEVISHTQTKISDLHQRDSEGGKPLIRCPHILALNCDRDLLYRRIEQRVDQMMQAGLLDEVRSLREQGYDPASRPMQTLGYKELNAHLNGTASLADAVSAIKQHTRQFARRQLIWFRADPRLIWIDAPPQRSAAGIAQEILDAIRAASR